MRLQGLTPRRMCQGRTPCSEALTSNQDEHDILFFEGTGTSIMAYVRCGAWAYSQAKTLWSKCVGVPARAGNACLKAFAERHNPKGHGFLSKERA